MPQQPCGAGGPCRVFVTSQRYQGGELAGLTGADTICNNLAAAAPLPGEYMAWLSDGEPGGDPEGRFLTQSSGSPYVLKSGTVIAANWTELTSGTLRAPIDVTEDGAPFNNIASVWTNTSADGTAAGTAVSGHCTNWTSVTSDQGGNSGVTTSTDETWTDEGVSTGCGNSLAIYCFQQA